MSGAISEALVVTVIGLVGAGHCSNCMLASRADGNRSIKLDFGPQIGHRTGRTLGWYSEIERCEVILSSWQRLLGSP